MAERAFCAFRLFPFVCLWQPTAFQSAMPHLRNTTMNNLILDALEQTAARLPEKIAFA